ncbi:hypothetical protein [Deinococcus alpinitundrae]|uniref:hypothetical protein n=1 Tax=Deinococcus alpinitundrae TaxID=468913 RepID=UPI00137B02AC|nr:hypothetical protein [Deinococcus alpinitundrae]
MNKQFSPTDKMAAHYMKSHNKKHNLFLETLQAIEANDAHLPLKKRYSNKNIVQVSKSLDPEGKGLNPTYWSNRYPDNQMLVYQARKWKFRFQDFRVNTAYLKAGRDLNAAYRRYLREWGNADLARRVVGLEERVISLEQRLAAHDQQLLQRMNQQLTTPQTSPKDISELLTQALSLLSNPSRE